MTPLDGTRALVTGGSRGIGRAVAVALARAGASDVAIGYVDNDAAAQEVCRAIEAAGARATAVRANLALADGTDRLFDEVTSRQDRLDVFVHCAASIQTARRASINGRNARSFLSGAQRAIMKDGGSIVAVGLERNMGPTKAAGKHCARMELDLTCALP